MKAAAVLTEKHEESAALFEKSKTQVVLYWVSGGAPSCADSLTWFTGGGELPGRPQDDR